MKEQELADKLKFAIGTLEEIRLRQRMELKQQFEETFDSLKPLNLLRNSIKGMTASPELKGQLVDSGIGLLSGIAAKKLFVRSSSNPLKLLGGVLLQALVTNLAAKNSDKIKHAGLHLLKSVLSHRRKNNAVFSESDIYED